MTDDRAAQPEPTIVIPEPLVSDVARGGCLPFVGSGFSKNAVLTTGATMPDWAELGRLLNRDAGLSGGADPLAIAERYQELFGRVQLIERVRTALYVDDARPGAAHRAFARLPFDTIYTTNFDLLLEDAFAQEGRPFVGTTSGTPAEGWRDRRRR